MSLPGRPSTACISCRAKKIKCDKGIPECLKCLRKGQRCPGYGKEVLLPYRQSNSPDEHDLRGIVRGSTPSPGSVTWSPSISPESIAVPRFFHDWVTPTFSATEHVPGGNLNFLDTITRQGFYQIPLYGESLKAVALASLANQMKDVNLLYKARLAHGATIKYLNEALQDRDQAIKDSTLAAVILMSLYEVIVRDSERPSLWEMHHDGWMLIIRLRGPEQFNTNVGQGMVRYIFAHLQAAFLPRSARPMAMPMPTHNPKFPVSALSGSVVRVSQYCARAQELKVKPNASATELLDHMNDATEITQELQKFTYAMTDERSYRNVAVAPARRSLPLAFPDWLTSYHIYADLRMAGVWNFWRCTHIFLEDAILKCIERLTLSDVQLPKGMLDERKDRAIDTMHKYADGILSAMPFLLGQLTTIGENVPYAYSPPIGAYFTLWNAQVLLTRAHLDEHRRSFITTMLAYIRDVLGINQADVLLKSTSNYDRNNTFSGLQAAISRT